MNTIYDTEYVKFLKASLKYDELIIYINKYINNNTKAMNDLAWCYYHGKGVEKDWNKCFEIYKNASNLGDLDALAELGLNYKYGIGVEKNLNKALELYLCTAQKDNSIGQLYLGVCYEYGTGVEKDEEKAAELYRKSAEQGNARGQLYLGMCYEYGTGVEKDEEKAAELYRKSAEQGNARGQLYLGMCYECGNGVLKNINMAIKYFNKVINNLSAETNEIADGYRKLGDCYDNEYINRKEEAQEMYKKAYALYEKILLEKENESAYYWLAKFYTKGLGVKKDFNKAFIFYKNAGTKAYVDLGDCYRTGKGTDRNEKKAIEFYKLGMYYGNELASLKLGQCYEYGIGVKKNILKAVSLFEEGIQRGNLFALVCLGMCYYHGGNGLEKDEKKAYEIFLKAPDVCSKKFYLKVIEDNDLSSMYMLGIFFSIDYSVFITYDEYSFYFYSLAAKNGHMKATLELAKCYHFGIGVKRNYKEAYELFTQLNNKGNIDAAYYLGKYYYYGCYVRKNLNKAVSFFRKAAQEGNADAAFCLAMCYEKGHGVEASWNKALMWYRKSANDECYCAKCYLGLNYLCGYIDTKSSVEEGYKLIEEASNYEYFYKNICRVIESHNDLRIYRVICNVLIVRQALQYQSLVICILRIIPLFFGLLLMLIRHPKNLKMELEIFKLRKEILEMKSKINEYETKGSNDMYKLIDNIQNKEFDFFISHASEDKNSIAEPLAIKLKDMGVNVWYDKFTLKLGDSLRESIDFGLAHSKYGIVILSEVYFKKFWTNKELNGLFERQESGKKIILPIWHKISKDIVNQYSPILADMVALKSSDYTVDELANELIDFLHNE